MAQQSRQAQSQQRQYYQRLEEGTELLAQLEYVEALLMEQIALLQGEPPTRTAVVHKDPQQTAFGTASIRIVEGQNEAQGQYWPRLRKYLPDSSFLIAARRSVAECRKMKEQLLKKIHAGKEEEHHQQKLEQQRSAEVANAAQLLEQDQRRLDKRLLAVQRLQAVDRSLKDACSRLEALKSTQYAAAPRKRLEEQAHRQVSGWMMQTVCMQPKPSIGLQGRLAAGTTTTAVDADEAIPAAGDVLSQTKSLSTADALDAMKEEQSRLQKQLEELDDAIANQTAKTDSKENVVKTLLNDINTLDLAMSKLNDEQEKAYEKLRKLRNDAENSFQANYDEELAPVTSELKQFEDLLVAEQRRVEELRRSLDQQYAEEAKKMGIMQLEKDVSDLQLTLRQKTGRY